MIDIKVLRELPEQVRASQRARGEDEEAVAVALAADEARRSSIAGFEAARAQQKELGKQVARSQGAAREELLARTAALAAQVKELAARAERAQAALDEALRAIGNIIEPGVPAGGEQDWALVDTVGDIPQFDPSVFPQGPRDHLALAEGLDALDMERGAKVAGSRFYFLKGVGARLELALLQLGVTTALEHGFTPMLPPTLVLPEVMRGAGFIDAHEEEVYRLRDDELYLTGTSEVALAGYHAGEILDLSNGPLRYAGWSTCYRREAGSYGKDTRGIIRVHQFNKLEMFVYCDPQQAAAEHAKLLDLERAMLAKIDVPYRVIDTAAGDLGGPAARKYDCEAWVPSQGKYRELTSTSNCTTFQARRLNTRFKDVDGRTAIVATLNGTLATTRWLVAILENHQQPDGSVMVPAALRPLLGLDLLQPVR